MASSRDRDARSLNEVASTLRDAFSFGEVAVGERLEGGYANDLFRVVADGRALVLRVKHPPVVDEDITWEHRLMQLLSARLPEVVAPLRARDGTTVIRVGERVGWLMPFLDGAPADAGRAGHRAAAARALGRVHRAGVQLQLSRRPRLRPLSELAWPPLRVPAELEQWSATIANERTWARSYVAALSDRRDLPRTLVHGDFFPGNVLVTDDGVSGIIDWEEAQVDWGTWDLACAIGSFCQAGDDLDADACRAFVDDYRAAGGTAASHDDDLLVPLMRVKRILEVLRAPTDRHPRWQHQRDNLRVLENLAKRHI
jgi:Ser/Thr protein kinase RdoA (MazF antagonist)